MCGGGGGGGGGTWSTDGWLVRTTAFFDANAARIETNA